MQDRVACPKRERLPLYCGHASVPICMSQPYLGKQSPPSWRSSSTHRRGRWIVSLPQSFGFLALNPVVKWSWKIFNPEAHHFFRTQCMSQIMSTLHFCGDPAETSDDPCFTLLQGLFALKSLRNAHTISVVANSLSRIQLAQSLPLQGLGNGIRTQQKYSEKRG